MSKEILVIKTKTDIYFPYNFFGGRMTDIAVVLNPGEPLLKVLSYFPERDKKKPTTVSWLNSERDKIMAAVYKPDDYEILYRAEISDYKYSIYYKYWELNLPNKCAELLESIQTT